MNKKRIIFHIDVNSAFLSWTAAYRLQQGEILDLRTIPAVVGGNPLERHGIVLAKSIPAKKYKIETGEPLFSAVQKCPELTIVKPQYDLYIKCSNAMVEVLKEYTPKVQRFSVDECFLEFTGMENVYGDYIQLAKDIKERIKKELGFTVNIGISSNKLLAKVASDFTKPDMVHTLFKEEIKYKMWPLPVGDLFMVGRKTVSKLNKLNIRTIGDLANFDLSVLKAVLKSHGVLIWNYANGVEDSEVRCGNFINMKGLGNSTTISFDVEDIRTAHMILLSLCETVGMRLRDSENLCSLVSVVIKNSDFLMYRRQRKIYYATDSTKEISKIACELFDEIWKGEALRLIGVSVSELCTNEMYQISIFEEENIEKERALDSTIDKIRRKYGSKAILRGSFLHSGINPINGGISEENYPIMSSIL